MQKKHLFTSESVSEGHPDKVADQISDAILDACLEQDPYSRVACETLVSTGLVVISGEISTKAQIDFDSIARNTIREIGYNREDYKFTADSCGVMLSIDKQSPDIAQGVNEGEGTDTGVGAGDQGIMFGYACDETEELLPATAVYSHQLLKELSKIRKEKEVDWLGPDSKAQVTAEYEDSKLKRIDTVLISTQHHENVSQEEIREFLIKKVIEKIIPSELLDEKTKYYTNPTGKFILGGPHADTGLTGRKIIVDTYGGHARHGGGAFSGKDASKVDRSAAYYARYMAKHVVASGAASKCEIGLAYAIGISKPVAIYVETFSTGDDEKIAKALEKTFDASPGNIMKELELRKAIYKKTASYGHFGRNEFPWEKLERLEEFKNNLS